MDYSRFLDSLKPTYELVIKYAYGNQKETVIHKFVQELNSLGFQTNFRYGKDWHVEMILHAVSIVEKVDAIVLATSNPIYRPLIPWLEAHGVKVHVISVNIPHTLGEVALCTEITADLLQEGK